MHDHPEYEISELLLCALFVAGAGANLLWAIACFIRGDSLPPPRDCAGHWPSRAAAPMPAARQRLAS